MNYHPHIKVLVDLYQSETQPFRKVHRMIDLFESIIKSHTAVILGEYVKQNTLSDAAKIKNIAPLAGLINLKELWLGDTDVTTIESLFGLKLENLFLNNDNVTDDEVFNFVKIHPRCRVYFKGKVYNDKKANIDLPF